MQNVLKKTGTRNKKITVSLSVMLLLTCFTISNVFAATNSLYLSVEGLKQEQSNWCWAATSKIVINYLRAVSPLPSQTNIVTTVKGSPVNQTANGYEQVTSLNAYNVTTIAKTSSVAFSELKDNIQNWYSPFKVSLTYANGGGHSLCVYGFYENTSSGIQNVSYVDPNPAATTFNSVSYNYLVSNSNYTWVRTFDYNRKTN